jgi:hypothetical protein
MTKRQEIDMPQFIIDAVLKLVPKEYKAYADVGIRIFQHLDTKDERDEAMDYFITATQSDGYMSAPEGSRWLSMLGLIGRPKQKKAKETEADEVIVAPTG